MDDPVARLTAALKDRYAIERQAGAGGMATVYLARDLKHGRAVAIKVLRPELAATMGTDRFLREIEMAARLHRVSGAVGQRGPGLPAARSPGAGSACPSAAGRGVRGRIDG